MASCRPESPRPLISSLLVPLLFLIVGLFCCSSFSRVSALPQIADEPRQLTLKVEDIEFGLIGKDSLSFATFLSILDFSGKRITFDDYLHYPVYIEWHQQDRGTILRKFIKDQRKFSYYLPDPLPNYVTDEPQPTLEDNMWLLEEIAIGEASDTALLQPWYQTFYMDRPFRMTVFYLGKDKKIYTGVIDIPAEAIIPDRNPVGSVFLRKIATLRPDYKGITFPMNFIQDIQV